MPEEIEKSEQPNPDEVLAAITSFNDPSIIVGIFKELGWSYTFEIKEWLMMAKQNANLAVKSKALIQLRKLLREAAETSGYIANVSSTAPNAQGGHTTFSAKRIAGVLNPVKKIESTIKEIENGKTKETESDRGSDRGQSQTEGDIGRTPERISQQDTERDAGTGGTEQADGGEASEQRPDIGREINSRGKENIKSCSDSDGARNPCVKIRPPTCNRELFPGIASAED